MKKINIKYKLAPKIEEQTCALCDYTSVSRSKVKQHMKTKHTDAGPCPVTLYTPTSKTLMEDMSVCGLSDNEEILLENKSCGDCDFIAAEENLLEKHMVGCHTMKSGLTLNEEVSNTPSFVKPLALYKCNECPFANTTTGAFQTLLD